MRAGTRQAKPSFARIAGRDAPLTHSATCWGSRTSGREPDVPVRASEAPPRRTPLTCGSGLGAGVSGVSSRTGALALALLVTAGSGSGPASPARCPGTPSRCGPRGSCSVALPAAWPWSRTAQQADVEGVVVRRVNSSHPRKAERHEWCTNARLALQNDHCGDFSSNDRPAWISCDYRAGICSSQLRRSRRERLIAGACQKLTYRHHTGNHQE